MQFIQGKHGENMKGDDHMQVLSEKEIEDILVLHPELIESGLTLLKRQGQLENRRTDLMFKDSKDQILLVELKKGVVSEDDIAQIEDYVQRINKLKKGTNRGMIIGQLIPSSIQLLCEERKIEWKEINVADLYEYLQRHNNDLLNQFFFTDKLNEKAKEVKTLSFHDYLNATSPFGVPYTSYQFFKPNDASPELSENNQENQIVADEIKEIILNMEFNRKLFNGDVQVIRKPDTQPRWVVKTKDGSWQGYVIDYLLYIEDNQQPVPCELYLGTIGYRGNPKAIFIDEKSRFIVLDIGKGKEKVSSQYGFHKYLNTKRRALFPYYELKFNAIGTPRENWGNIYYSLNEYGYIVKESEDKKSNLLWIGEIELGKETTEIGVANLIEALFATTVVKSHYMKVGKGISFEFLSN